MANTDDNLTEVLQRLKSGARLLKCKPNGKKYSRRYFLHEREDFISYDRSRKVFGKPQIYNIKDIDEVRIGFAAETFDRLLKRGSIKPDDRNRAFSIIFDNHRKGEHFIASNTATRDLWAKGLEYLKNQHAKKTQHHFIREKNWILEFFYSADKDHSNKLSKSECRNLLADSFNLKMDDKAFEKLFNQVDETGHRALNSTEFENFFKLLTRREDLYDIMKTFVKDRPANKMENIFMNKYELLNFLQQMKNENIKDIDNPIELQRLIDTYELNVEFRDKGLLSLDGFRNMLLSRSFDIIESLYSRQVYQDMTRPLSHYYINTSHNTYLFYSQISGDSDPEAYNRVLLMGCRCVEFDCYDGDDGNPIVKHGFTLVKACSFESIIRCIEPNLFKASPYPVVFNIENHCSIEQQKQMARILKTILGGKLITKPLSNNDPMVLPSPEDLKYKVLIRGIEPELDELFVYLLNVPYRDNSDAKRHYKAFNSSSLSESNFLKAAQKDPTDFVEQTMWRIIRTYPDGVRQDSSNPNPIYAWNFGVQMAALNYQTEDDIMPLNFGKFLDNGSCGYVLKPDYLLDPNIEFNPWGPQENLETPTILTVKIISGQFLLRSDSETKDIPDVYVKISTHGISSDEKVHKTKVISNNGFNPFWNESFEFQINYPELCLVYFNVMDSDAFLSDDRIARFCAPLNMLQTGYRHIHLRANNNDTTYSTLFVHIGIEQDVIRVRF